MAKKSGDNTTRKKATIPTTETPATDYYDKILKWAKGKKTIVFFMFAAPALGMLVGAPEAITKARAYWISLKPRAPVSFGAALYLEERAIRREGESLFLYQEMRDLQSGCRLNEVKIRAINDGPQYSVGPNGAEVRAHVKLRLQNEYGDKLTNLKFLLAPLRDPLDLNEVAITPNASIKMSRPAVGGDVARPYLLEVPELLDGQYVVITLSTLIDRKNIAALWGQSATLTLLSFRADQLQSASGAFPNFPTTPFDILLDEGAHTSGQRSINWGFSHKTLGRGEQSGPSEYSFIHPAKDCSQK